MGRSFTFGIASLVVFLQFIAMAFLIIACVTAPVFKQIGLSKYDDVTYGTFGYCNSDGCSSAQANYNPQNLSTDGNWKMSSTARESLGKILIVTPIAAGLSFFAMFSSFFSQFGFFNSISGMFVVNLFFSVLGFLSSALICIVVFLLFFPNVTWCTYILVPAAVLNLISIPLAFLAYSQFTRANDSGEDDGSSSIRDKFYKDELSKDDFQRDLTSLNDGSMLEYYKNPQIMTSRTLNSTVPTTDEMKSEDVASMSYTLQNQRELNFGNQRYGNNSTPRQPYSAIEDMTSSHASLTGRIRAPGNTPSELRANSLAPSSVYVESNQESNNYVKNEEKNAGVTEVIGESKSQQDVLQDIINGVLADDEDEFLKQNTVDPSERPVDDFDDDDDGIKDDDSQFTSVSQRGINPNYYQGKTNRPNLPHVSAGGAFGRINTPEQFVPASNYQAPISVPMNNAPPQGLNQLTYYTQQVQLPQQQHPLPQPQIGGYYPAPMPQVQHQPQIYQGPPSQQRPVYSSGPTASDILLQSNPEFSVGGPSTASGQRIYGGGNSMGTTSHYKPAYKKRMPRQNNLPPASMTRDSPYGNF